MPKQVKVKLGGREYTIVEKFSGITEQWRKHLRESGVFVTFQQLDSVVEQVVHMIEGGVENMEPAQVISVARILPAIVNSLAVSMDEIKSLIFDYVPEIAADREWLGEHVYDSEYVEVFLEVLKINFPIMGALDLIRGFKAPGISTNLPSTNGATGTKKRTARSKAR
jgi:hypothetical protein